MCHVVIVNNHTKGNEGHRANARKDYATKPFTSESIRGDLTSMENILREAGQPGAALACSNARRMICHLDTLRHEALLPLFMALSDMERGDKKSAKKRLKNVETLLKDKVVMDPESPTIDWPDGRPV